jgi:uncharacterized protein (TIGR00369 family)
MIRGEIQPTGFHQVLRLARPVRWEPGTVWLEWQVDPDFFLPGPVPVLFGGYTAALIDNAAAVAVSTVLEEGTAWTTSDLRVSYFRPITEGVVHIHAEVVHENRAGLHIEIVLTRDDGKMAAKGTVIQNYIRPRSPRPPAAADGGADAGPAPAAATT